MPEIIEKVEKLAKEKIARRGIVQEFREFINRGNVVDLSVAFVMGAAFKTVVDSFAGSATQPGILGGLIGAIFGGKQPDFSKKYVSVNGSHIELGAFATSTINFILVSIALFVVVKLYNRFRDKDDGSAAPEVSTNDLLIEIRDELRAQRGGQQ
jgi:large conductance mechanosensitive channel